MDKQKITEYVERVFELYGISKYDFFYTYDDDSEENVIIPLFDDSIETEAQTLTRISFFLGLTEHEIETTDKKAALRYWNKYPFFPLHNEFMRKRIWYAKYKSDKPSAEQLLYSAIFDKDIPLERQYNYKDIKQRFISELQEAAAFDEDYYPPNSRLHILNLETAEFFSFPKCEEMIRSYIDLIKRVQDLFFKAINNDLTSSEVNEYNFLVSYFDIHDICMPRKYLFYHNVVKWRDIFLKEGYKEFWSYAKIGNPLSLEAPWRCVEFFDNIELVQEFVNIFPASKKEMREFAALAQNYLFTFQWEETKTQEQLDDEFVEAYLAGKDYDPGESRGPILRIYIEKEQDKLEKYSDALKAILKAASPPSKGGMKLPTREYSYSFRSQFARLNSRLAGR